MNYHMYKGMYKQTTSNKSISFLLYSLYAALKSFKNYILLLHLAARVHRAAAD